jgi:hypothetical protein
MKKGGPELGEEELDSGLAEPRIRIGEIVQIGIVVKDIGKAVECLDVTLGEGEYGPTRASDSVSPACFLL